MFICLNLIFILYTYSLWVNKVSYIRNFREPVRGSMSNLYTCRDMTVYERIIYNLGITKLIDYHERQSFMKWNIKRFWRIPIVRKNDDGSITIRQKNIKWILIAIGITLILGFVSIYFFGFFIGIMGAAFTSKASGGADQGGQTTWNEVGVPGVGDPITIQNTHTVFLESNSQYASILINGGGTLTTTDGTDWNLTVPGAVNITGDLNVNDSVCSFGRIGLGATATLTCNHSSNEITIIGDGVNLILFNQDGTVSGTCNLIIDISVPVVNQRLDFDGTGTVNNVEIDSAGETIGLQGNVTHTIGGDFTLTAGTFTTRDEVGSTENNLTVNANLSIASGGTLTGNAATIIVYGNATNNGTFNPGTSSFEMDGTNQDLLGSWSFYDFTKIVGTAETLTFEAGETIQFITGGTITINGATGQLLALESDTPGTRGNFTVNAGATIGTLEYLIVSDSDASGSDSGFLPLDPPDSVDAGNNKDWFPSAGSHFQGFKKNNYRGFY